MSEDLTLEKMKVVERLANVESSIKTLIEVKTIKMDLIEKNIEQLNHIIIGNGEMGLAENLRSLQTSVASLKDKDDRRDKDFMKMIWAVGLLFIDTVWKMIFPGK